MKHSFLCLLVGTWLACGLLAVPAPAQDLLRISEFMAVNDGPLTDEDGDESDWIEIHNAGTNGVDLAGWYLTDSDSNLKRWEFPATNLPPNSFLLVFASNKDRRVAGAPLHTNFRLDAGGEFLGLVAPDGTTVVSAYAPAYPPQVGLVSFGIPIQQTSVTLLTAGAAAKVHVPTSDVLGYTWTETNFNDAAWLPVTTGVGFETDGQTPFVPEQIADSVAEFSGTQGTYNWSYGYWNKSADADGVYADAEFVPFPNSEGPWGPTNFWNGSAWTWFAGSPPWTQLTSQGGHPSAVPANHWAIRRYVSEFTGPLKITGTISHVGSTSRDWVYITASGVASSASVPLYLYLTAAGDGYIDDLKLVAGPVAEVGANLLSNGDLESGLLTPWTIGTDGNMAGSTVVSDVQHGGTRSLRLVATAGGTTQASSVYQSVSGLVSGQTYTLSYWFRPGTTPAPLIVRFSGNWISTSFTPVLCGDGVVGRILVDGVEVFQKTVFMTSADVSVKTLASVGSRVDFVLDAGPSNNDNCDASTFTARIDTEDPNIVVVADSVADWSFGGVQGEKNWYYGYYNKTTDPDRTYQATNFAAFPRNDGPHGVSNYWNGTIWDWFNGNPPWDEIGQTGEHPNGSNSTGGEHYVIRRWVSEVRGRITVDWTVVKVNTAGGNGVTGRIFHNGVQRDFATIAGTDGVGVARTVAITNVQVGDFIDIALDALGTDGQFGDSSDGSAMTAVIRGAPSVSGGVASDIQAAMKGVNASAYLRIPFVVTNASPVNFLTLRMKYDDGFVAYLNGVAVAGRNAPVAPDMPLWNSTATGTRPDNEAVQFEDIDLTPVAGLLRPGNNLLAIHGLNISPADGDFLVLPELRGASVISDATNRLYFSVPTPGAPNGLGNTNLGPLIVNVKHAPDEPADHEDLYVTAEIIRTFHAISNVTLTYRVMYSNEVTVPMFDDGQHADGLAGDGVWGGIVPADASNPAQMVRYFVYATDARTNRTRLPAYLDTVNSPQYQGTVVADPSIVTALPVFHMFIQNPTAADNATGTKCSLFYLGRFYDNCGVNLHGQSSQGFPKKSYDFDFNPGYNFVWKEGEKAVDDINFMSTWADKSHLRNILAYDAYEAAGAGYHWTYPIRVQQNGAFHSLANLMENGDAGYLDRLGLDPNGALYKMYNQFNSVGSATIGVNANAEKKTRKTEGNADLVALYNGVRLTGQALVNYIYDNIDLPSSIGMLAGHVLANDEDCCHKNYYFYRDTEGTGEWRIMPWDVDLSFGHTWTSDFAYYNPAIYATNRYSQTTLGIGGGNHFVDALFGNPAILQMYHRRVRTITDEQLQSPNTHPYLLKYETMVNRLAADMEADAALDYTKWVVPRPTVFPPIQTLAQGIADLNVNYFPPRRWWIYNILASTNQPTDPYNTARPYIPPQPADVVIRFGALEFNPGSGNQAQEYIQFVNTNRFPVDISDWKITGAVEHTFRRGTVIPSDSVIYVSPDVIAFRARATAPRGGMGLFVQGNYKGQLSARGEALQLVDKGGRLVQSTNYPGDPSLPQLYLRITEIMYHPSGANDFDPEEYLELKNTGPVPMSLVGVHFANGIEFRFTASGPVTSLGPGESVVLVRDLAAFRARYGSGPRVAGQYSGALDNGGENLRLDDASGEKILDFEYDNQWYPVTDGFGFSLAILNEATGWTNWGLKESWRASGRMLGSPGTNDPSPLAIAPVVINELLANSEPPQVDAIELHNPTTNTVNVGGWFITDDTTNVFKFRIPNGTSIPPGDYFVFTEAEFNPGGAGFAFSSGGDEVYLLSGDANTNLTGYLHGFSFGASETGVSFGRHVTSVGEEHFVAQSAVTLTNANAGPKVGPVVISEIMFRPPDLPDSQDNQDGEYVELRNLTASPVPLFASWFPGVTNVWRVHGGIDFDFPANVTLAPNGALLLVSFNPTNEAKLAALRSRYGVAPTLPVFGPYQGKLDNSADSVKLSKPVVPELGQVPYILVDAVEYQDSAPWPDGADGTGASLQRIHLSQYGNDPVNWTAGVPNVGGDFAGGTAPAITAQPLDQGVLAFSEVTFSVGVTGSGPLRYQWRRNGMNLEGATNAQLVFSPEPLTDAAYSVAVFNSAGAVLSSNAWLTVYIPALIMQQPQSRTVFPTTNVTFTVAAASSSPIQYQWRFNNVAIPGATNTSYTVTNAQAVHDGEYRVNVTDAAGSVLSAPARLTVLLHPWITGHPTNRLASIGTTPVNVSFSVTASSGTPMTYQWFFEGTPVVNAPNIGGATTRTLNLTNVQMSQAGDYWVVVTDSYGSATSAVATLSVVIKPAYTLHPASETALFNGTVTFQAAASGDVPISFRWRFSGTTITTSNLPNAYTVHTPSTSTLVLTNLLFTNASVYSVVATNIAGQASGASSNAYLVVVVPPANISAAPGANVTLRTVVGLPKTYTNRFVWQFHGTNVLAGTNASTSTLQVFTNDLALSNLTPAQSGAYTFLITNVLGKSAAFTAVVLIDSDGDGLPDDWELAHGFNPNNPADGAADADGDGLSNAAEYQAGTDYLNPASVLRLDVAAAGPVTLWFTAAPDRTYTVQYSDGLDPASWRKLADVPAQASARVEVVTDPAPSPNRFYRLITPRQP